jgi:hypothetical protein
MHHAIVDGVSGFDLLNKTMPLAGNLGMGVVITSYNQQIFISIGRIRASCPTSSG